MSGQVLDGVQERLHVARQASFEATLADHRLGGMDEEASREFADRQAGGAAAFRRELDALASRIDERMSGPMGNGASQQALVGYGLPIGEGRFMGTPRLGFGLSEGRHDYTLGWHLSVARRQDLDLTVGVEANRLENPDAGNPEHGVRLQFRLGY